MDPYDLRLALPDELSVLFDIDDDACRLFAEAGLPLTLTEEHPFVVEELARWRAALAVGNAWVALRGPVPVGFAVLGTADGGRLLDQLSVRHSEMRKGVGRKLLTHAIEASAGAPLWLTTYGHMPWNRPWYERAGFRVVPEEDCGPDMRHHLEQERAALPAPEQRVAMVRAPRS